MKTLKSIQTISFLFISIILNSNVFATTLPGTTGFVKNNGQVADQNGNLQSQISYYSAHSGYNVFFSNNFIQYDLNKYKTILNPNPIQGNTAVDSITVIDSIMQLKQIFFGANNNSVIQSNGIQNLKYNFYLPHCSTSVTNVAAYNELVYQSIYPNIDLRYYFDGSNMKYEFIVYPGGNPNAIQFQYTGAANTFVDVSGKLNVETTYGTLIEQAPYISQNGIPVTGSFLVSGDTTSFSITSYNSNDTLIIDPFVDWTSFFGGNNFEQITSIRTRTENGVEYFYGTGTFDSAPWLAINNSGILFGGVISAPTLVDGILFKINSDGSTNGNCWITYYGGEGSDFAWGLSVDANNNVAVCGTTNSEQGIGQNPIGGGSVYMIDHYSMAISPWNLDGFIMTFDQNGTKQWGTYYGGEFHDFLDEIDYDDAGNVYVAGHSGSTNNISTLTAFGGGATHQQSMAGGGDGILASFNNLGAIRWGTYFGGTIYDRFFDLCVINGHVYAGGQTKSNQNIIFGNPGITIHTLNDEDGFLVDFSLNGNYINSTYYGGNDNEIIRAVTADDINVYISGYTYRTTVNYAYAGGLPNQPFAFDNNTCQHVHQTTYGTNQDAFIASIPVALNAINWCTYFGGGGSDAIFDLDNNCEFLLIGGETSSSTNINFPSPNTPVIQPVLVGSVSGTIAAFRKGTGAIYFGTYYGGLAQVQAVRFGQRYTMYAAGQALQNPWVTEDNLGNPLLNQNGGGFTQFQPQPTPGIGGDGMMMRCQDEGLFEQFCSTCYANTPVVIYNAGNTYNNINCIDQTIHLVGAGDVTLQGTNNLISGCEIICDQDVRLVVKPNAILNIINTANTQTYFHACNGESWKGVYQEYNLVTNSGKITIQGNDRGRQVRIEDAQVGLQLNDGPPFICEYVNFNRNLTGIGIDDDVNAIYVSNNYDCAIVGCSFTCTSDLNCAFGLGVIRGKHGIYAFNFNTPPSTNGVLIGESTIDPDLLNDFSDTEMGIKLENSNAIILNNQFSNFFTNQTSGLSYNEGVAIRITPNSTNDPLRVDVGAPSAPVTSPYYNFFKDCFRGIMMGNSIGTSSANGLKVHYNQFSNIHGLTTNTQSGTTFLSQGPNAIEVDGGLNNTYDIEHNEFNEIDFGGINLHDLSYCSAEIHFNIFNNSQTAAINNKSEAIHVYSVAIINLQAKITNNRITNFRFGINCSGLKSPQIIRNAPIDFFRSPGITNANGIRLTNTSFATVERNFTTCVSGNPNAVGPCGIYIENCNNAYFNHNVTNMGRYGFYFNGLSSNFNMVCNSFNNHVTSGGWQGSGVYFNGCNPTTTIISSNIGSLAASGNQWSNCTPFHVGAIGSNLSAVTWHYDGGLGFPFNPNIPFSATNIIFNQFAPPDNCINLIVPPIVHYDSTDEESREKMIGGVVGDTTGENANYELPNDEETRYRITERAFRDLYFGKIPLYMGASSDPLYVSFFDSVMTTNISLIAMVDSALSIGDTISAEQLNNQITSANLSEAYKKIVNAIFIDKLKSHADSLTTEQFNTLLAIATQPAWLSDAIYQAREMLNVTVDEEDCSYREEESGSTQNNLVVQPNPADKIATVLLSVHEAKTGSLTITNTAGKIIYNKKINSSDIVINLSTATWAQGVYFVKFDADGISNNGKLIIVH